jgi:hypothetical protein
VTSVFVYVTQIQTTKMDQSRKILTGFQMSCHSSRLMGKEIREHSPMNLCLLELLPRDLFPMTYLIWFRQPEVYLSLSQHCHYQKRYQLCKLTVAIPFKIILNVPRKAMGIAHQSLKHKLHFSKPIALPFPCRLHLLSTTRSCPNSKHSARRSLNYAITSRHAV